MVKLRNDVLERRERDRGKKGTRRRRSSTGLQFVIEQCGEKCNVLGTRSTIKTIKSYELFPTEM